jgi:hypothetical protein
MRVQSRRGKLEMNMTLMTSRSAADLFMTVNQAAPSERVQLPRQAGSTSRPLVIIETTPRAGSIPSAA